MARKRKPGKKYPDGFVKGQIILYVAQKHPKGLAEPELRDMLREKHNIREPRGIKEHLRKLKNLYLRSDKEGVTNYWYVDFDISKNSNKTIQLLDWLDDSIINFMQTPFSKAQIDPILLNLQKKLSSDELEQLRNLALTSPTCFEMLFTPNFQRSIDRILEEKEKINSIQTKITDKTPIIKQLESLKGPQKEFVDNLKAMGYGELGLEKLETRLESLIKKLKEPQSPGDFSFLPLLRFDLWCLERDISKYPDNKEIQATYDILKTIYDATSSVFYEHLELISDMWVYMFKDSSERSREYTAKFQSMPIILALLRENKSLHAELAKSKKNK